MRDGREQTGDLPTIDAEDWRGALSRAVLRSGDSTPVRECEEFSFRRPTVATVRVRGFLATVMARNHARGSSPNRDYLRQGRNPLCLTHARTASRLGGAGAQDFRMREARARASGRHG
jgi:hypothetical protein